MNKELVRSIKRANVSIHNIISNRNKFSDVCSFELYDDDLDELEEYLYQMEKHLKENGYLNNN